MSLEAMAWFYEDAPFTDRTAHDVLGCLCFHANKKDQQKVWISQETLARETHYHRITVGRALGRLEAAELITNTGEWRNRCIVWQINLHDMKPPGLHVEPPGHVALRTTTCSAQDGDMKSPGATQTEENVNLEHKENKGSSGFGVDGQASRNGKDEHPSPLNARAAQNGSQSISPAQVADDTTVAEGLCEFFAQAKLRKDSHAKVEPKSLAWLEPMRLLVEDDGRSEREIQTVVDWALRDKFWTAQIKTPGLLRSRFEDLYPACSADRAAHGYLPPGMRLHDLQTPRS